MYHKIKTLTQRVIGRFTAKQWITIGCATIVAFCVAITIIPYGVTFSYSGESCRSQIVALPFVRQPSGSAPFSITYHGGIKVARAHLLSTRTCVTAASTPREGSYLQRSSMWWYVLGNVYRITVPKAPQLRSANPEQTTIAIVKPLSFKLQEPDVVHAYHVLNGQAARQKCSVSGLELSCHIDKLNLAQGAEHEVSLARSFASDSLVELTKNRITVLPAVAVVSQSIQPNQTVYSIPKELTLTTDAPLASAQATLGEIDGEVLRPVAVDVHVKDTMVIIKFAAELPREKSYKLQLHTAESVDGTMLAQPYEFTFITSGGPKVSGVSIGSSGVSPSADIRLGFDQIIVPGQDIKRFVSLEGATGSITYSGKEVRIKLQDAGRCAAFTITVSKGIVGESGVGSKEVWRHTSRISCRSTSTVGYSVNGRPITAYYYGSGATTILFTGGIHGTEASGSTILKDWITHLDSNAHKIPAGRQVVVIPDTNPDGLAAGTRDNVRGVNIDRNFPTANWKTDINSANGFRPGGGGPSAASEPETQALMKITNQLRPRLEVSYHAQGRIVGASACGASAAVAQSYASGVRYGTMIGTAEEVMGYELTGEYEEWICEAFGTPAILIELPTRTGRFFSSHVNTMWQMVNY